jgi:hypothetical protein
MNFGIVIFIFEKSVIGRFMGIPLNLYIVLNSMDILTLLGLLVY